MKILAFPYDATNPYQSLLYKNLEATGATARYLKAPTVSHTLNLLLLPLVCAAYRSAGYKIFHLHWTYTFSLPWAGNVGRFIMQGYFYIFLSFLRILGYRIVWTAHNTLPHERVFLDDVAARRMLGKMSYRILAHTASGVRQLTNLGIDGAKIKLVPHGSYSGTYTDKITRREARKKLGINESDTAVLFFGQIRPYKGIEELLESYARISDLKKPVLIIAGSVKDASLSEVILAYAKREKKLHTYLQFIPDDEIQTFFKAADFSVLPYAKSTTSAVALLSSTFGRPVIAPNLPIFTSMPFDTRIIYENGGLTNCLSRLQDITPQKLKKMSNACKDYADSLAWDKIAQIAAKAIS